MSFLDPVFNPLLSLGAVWAILIVSLIVSLIATLAYKFATNQEEMKRLKAELKEKQKEMKEAKSDPQKVLELQKQTMQVNMQYMKQSFKPTIITMIPILLIFGWLQAHFAYDPIMAGETFNVVVNAEGEVSLVNDNFEVIDKKELDGGTGFKLKALDYGKYFLDFKHENETYSKEIIITETYEYAEPLKNFENKPVKSIMIDYGKFTPLGDFSLFGWKLGWLALYFIFSLVFSIGLRKLMKLH